jgi:hypothetical protein
MEPEQKPVEPETIPETSVVKVKKPRSPAQLEVLFRARLKAAESIQKRVATKKSSVVEVAVPDEKVIQKPELYIVETPKVESKVEPKVEPKKKKTFDDSYRFHDGYWFPI